jgi:NitT/TauT family transport system substrate-binding protein
MMRISIKYFLTIFVCFFIGGCFDQSSSPMRVGTNLWPGYEPLHLADDLNLWSDKDIRLLDYPSASEVIRAFRNKSLDAAALTLDEVLSLHQANIQADVVLVLDVSDGGDVIVSKGQIKQVTDLKGMKVGIENGALGAYVISRALALNNMAISDIQAVSLDISEHERGFKEGLVDAVVTFEPVRSKLLAFGGIEIFNSKQIPGEIVDVLVVRRDYIAEHPDKVAILTKGWFQSLNFLKTKPDEAAAIVGKRLKLTPEQVLASYEGLALGDKTMNSKMLGSQGSLNRTLHQLGQTMVEIQLLDVLPPLEGVLNDRFIQ